MKKNESLGNRRVVVTGLGVVSPIGIGLNEFWSGIRSGQCGIDRISLFDASRVACQVAAEIKNFSPNKYLDHKTIQRSARFTHFALIAAQEAIQQSGILNDPKQKEILERAAIILGNGIGGLDVYSESQLKIYEKGPSRMSALTIPKMISNEAAGNISIEFGIQGLAHSIATACASGTDAIGHALNYIRFGQADVVVTGGTEAAITEFGVAGFCALKALSTSFNDQPQKSSRPFDQDRDGFVMGEGAGILVLESLDHALQRGAPILAEVVGWGVSSDAYHITSPDAKGIGPAKAIDFALTNAQMNPVDIQYINAHGTSTPTNDPIETAAIKRVFSSYAYQLKVSSIKGMIGHCLGAAGAIEAITCIQSIRDHFFPATINLENPDPLCDLDYVPNAGQSGTILAAMSISLGFGGHNSVLIFKKY